MAETEQQDGVAQLDAEMAQAPAAPGNATESNVAGGDAETDALAAQLPTLVPVPNLVLEPTPAPAEAAPVAERKPAANQAEASQSPFSITISRVYDGPLDLLLDLIRKQNIDIYDIPIARITEQFLAYCHHLQQTDVDSAGDFIYTAALLIHIKSKMLLPREAAGIAAGEIEDPRRELVNRLLEHERFRAAAQMLLQKQQIENATWTNPGIDEFAEAAQADREIAADTTDLARVFRDILERVRQRPVLNVDPETVTVAQMIEYTRRRLLLEDRPTSLRKLLANTHSQQALLCMFLALLELVRLQAIHLRQTDAGSDILIKKTPEFEDVLAHTERLRDDWR